MASGKGHNGGFNPFRDAHGRFSSKGNTGKTTNDMNANIRAVAGRGGSSGGGGKGDGDDDAPKPGALISNALLAKVDKLPAADGSKLSAATRAMLDEAINALPYSSADGQGVQGVFDAYAPSLNSVAFELISAEQGTLEPAHAKGLLQAYQEHGYTPPAGAKDWDLLAALDAVTDVEYGSPAYENRTSYGIALALKTNRPEVALTLADGPEGAGIGWDLTRQNLGAPPRDDD